MLTPERLRCEYREDPLGIDTPLPRLSWELRSPQREQRQSAYRVLVSSSPQRLEDGVGDFWDSGIVGSEETIGVEYAGTPLSSRQRCYWRVGVWDRDREGPFWSDQAWWETAFLSLEEWRAEWINDGRDNPTRDNEFYRHDPAPLFRKEFTADSAVAAARLYVSGLGYYRASLNGTPVGDCSLEPAWTAYEERVLYATYDVTSLIRTGENVIGVSLGNGWYNPLPLRMWGRRNLREHLAVGRPRLRAQLHLALENGEEVVVGSDRSWRVSEGPIRFNSIYLGEIYDARYEIPGWDTPGYDDSHWRKPGKATERVGPLHAQSLPPIRVRETFRPESIRRLDEGTYVVDMGRNFTGWIEVDLEEEPGTEITLRYGELLHDDGTVNVMTSVAGQIKPAPVGSPPATNRIGGKGAPAVADQADRYVARGGGRESFRPTFTWHAFRYVEISGVTSSLERDDILGIALASDVAQDGEFACSDERVNRIEELCRRTFTSNLMSVQSDCPHRERFGYGGDIVATADAFAITFDMSTFYAKSATDFADAASPTGEIPDTAPSVGLTYCGVGWAMVHPVLLATLYRYYGDRRTVEREYDVASRWLDSVSRAFPDHVVESGLGDHESLAPQPADALVTQLYRESARLLARLAGLAGRPDDATRYHDLAEAIRRAYVERFVDESNGVCDPGTQSAHAFALGLDMLPDDVRPRSFERLARELAEGAPMTTGIFGTPLLLRVLAEAGRADLAMGKILRDESPGYLHMVNEGATTLWEHWEYDDFTYSHNHPMFGSVRAWLYNWIGGIEPHPDARGCDRLLMRPQIVSDISWARASLRTVRGRVVSQWKRNGESLLMDVSIPPGVSATVILPSGDPESVTEGSDGRPVGAAEGVTGVAPGDGLVRMEIASGAYHFASRFPPFPDQL